MLSAVALPAVVFGNAGDQRNGRLSERIPAIWPRLLMRSDAGEDIPVTEASELNVPAIPFADAGVHRKAAGPDGGPPVIWP